jgi:hypothetical protein
MYRQFNRLAIVLLLSFTGTTVLPIPVKAQSSDIGCRQAVANAKTRLQKSSNSTSVISITETEHHYSDSPAKRTRLIRFYFDYFKDPRPPVKVGIENILNSPQLMKNISQDIINKCSSIGIVSFSSTFQAGCPVDIGLMSNSRVQIFESLDPSEVNREPKWGENYCT